MTTLAPPIRQSTPRPESYGETYTGQLFDDPEALQTALDEISDLDAPITLKDQEGLLEKTHKLAQSNSEGFLVTVGPCMGKLIIEDTVEMIVAHHLAVKDAITHHSGLEPQRATQVIKDTVTLFRATNYEKPRTKLIEVIEDEEVYSVMGPAVNSEEERSPDPTNLVHATRTSAEILSKSTARIREIEGSFAGVYFAREGLVTPRIQAERRGQMGARYNGFSHVVWLGNRTRGAGNPQEKELAKLEKSHIQIKIDQHTSADEIARLHRQFNPDNIDGKLGYILRVGVANLDTIQGIIEAIQANSPNSLIISDPMHNNTYSDQKTGQKTRSLEDMTTEMFAVIEACQIASTNNPAKPVRCHGIHLEAGDSVNETECVDNKNQHPTKSPELDPLLNMSQLTEILSKFVRKSLKKV